MSILSDRWIREQAQQHAMIEPFVEAQRREGCISYGLSSYGYDARVADEFKIFTNVDSATVDPKDFAANSFVDRKTDVCIIPPNSFALARTVEYFRVPRDVLVICLGKSTYARFGLIYLDGNSLGALPAATPAALASTVERQWGDDLIASWNKHGWIDWPARIAAKLTPIVGAKPSELVIADSTSVCLFKLLAAAVH